MREKNQSVETDSEIQITELASKDINMVTTIIFHMFKKLKERWSTLNRDSENTRKTQIKSLDTETKMSQIKSIPNGNNSRLHTAEDEISELEEKVIETIQNKPQREKKKKLGKT